MGRRNTQVPPPCRCDGVLFYVFLAGLLMTFAIIVVTVPLRDRVVVRRDASATSCKLGEQLNTELGLCAPDVRGPVPVSPVMFDGSVAPCDSFYHYTCGSWIKNHTNEDRSFSYVARKNARRTQALIVDPDSGPIHLFYRSCVDAALQGQQTQQEINLQTAELTDAPLVLMMARMAKLGYIGAPIIASIERHPTRPGRLPLIRHGGIPPAPAIATTPLELAAIQFVLDALSSHYKAAARAAGEREDDDMDYIEYVQTAFQRDVYNISNSDFWGPYFYELGVSPPPAQIWIQRVDKLFLERVLADRSIDQLTWTIYFRHVIAYNLRGFVPRAQSDSYLRRHHMTRFNRRQIEHHLQPGQAGQADCVGLTNSMLPGLVGHRYMDLYMPNQEAVRQKIVLMASRIRDQYAQLLHETTWMSTQTRTRAVEKIQSIEVRAIHPNTWSSEPFANQIRPDRFAANLNLVRKYRAWRNYAQSDTEAVQRFGAPLSTVNAFYSPVSNTVTIFAGIVTEPFYSDSYSDLSLYATLGMIIGHELSHAMDNQGRLFDLHGSLRNWWAHNDSVVFDRLSQCIVREYGSPEGCPNMQYGDQTLGEDIADIIGITLAFRTYFQHTRRRRSFEILDDQQNFFRIFAQMWSSSYDQSMTCSRVAEDEHAIAWYRVDKTLRQVPVFHQVFGCGAGSPMVNPVPCRIYGE